MTTSKQSIPSVSTTDLRKYLDYLKSVRQTASSTPKGVFVKQFSFSGKGHLTAIDPVYKQFFGQECEVMDVTGIQVCFSGINCCWNRWTNNF